MRQVIGSQPLAGSPAGNVARITLPMPWYSPLSARGFAAAEVDEYVLAKSWLWYRVFSVSSG